MSATFDAANDEILAFFATAWTATSLLALYENVEGAKPTAQDAWARVSLRHGAGRQSSLSGAASTSRFERTGILTVQIFIPNGQGLSQGYTLGKIVMDAFEGKATASQIWFRNAKIAEIGSSDEWFQLNVTMDFIYDEIK